MSTWISALPEWEEILRRDADAYFARGTGLDDVRPLAGRPTHFSYRPAPDRPRLFVRPYRHGGLVRVLGGSYLGRGRLESELRMMRNLRAAGLPLPAPAGGVSRGGAICELALVTEEIEGAVTLLERLRDEPTRAGLRRVAAAVRRLAGAGVAHPDLNVRNILMRGDEVWFVDFDNAGYGDASGLVPRLNRSLEKSLGPDYSVSRSDRWRFLAEYTGGSAYAMREIAWDCANVLWLQRILWKLFGR